MSADGGTLNKYMPEKFITEDKVDNKILINNKDERVISDKKYSSIELQNWSIRVVTMIAIAILGIVGNAIWAIITHSNL